MILPVSSIPAISGPEDFKAYFHVSRETLERLKTYEALLRKWQKAVNLVSPGTLDRVWQRHFADSAQLLAHAGKPKLWLDIGSGAGFPGLVIAILLANRSDVSVHLVESNTRKCAFLAEVVRQTGASVEIHASRIESLGGGDTVIAADIISARALAPLDSLLGLAMPFLGPDASGAPDAKGLFLKGKGIDVELAAAKEAYSFDLVLHDSMSDEQGRIAVISQLRKTEPIEKSQT